MGGVEHDRPYYGPARTAGGLGLIVVGALYVLVSPILNGHDPDPIVLGIILAAGITLLGVEGANKLLGR